MRYRRLTLIIHRAAVGQVRIARWLAWIRALLAGVTRISPAVTGARIGTARPGARMEVGTVTGPLRIRGGGQIRQVSGALLGRSGRVARRPGQVVGWPGPLVRRWLRQVFRQPGLLRRWRRWVGGWPLGRWWLGPVFRRPGLLRRWRRWVGGWPLGRWWLGPVFRRPGLLWWRRGQVLRRTVLVRR